MYERSLIFTLFLLMASVSFSPLGNVSSNTHILTSSEFHWRKNKTRIENGSKSTEHVLEYQNFHSLNSQDHKSPESNREMQLT